jgi:hypothetical protein
VVVQFLHAFADLQYAVESVALAHLVVFAEVEGVPDYGQRYQSEPPEQYSVMYQTASGWSMISYIFRMF